MAGAVASGVAATVEGLRPGAFIVEATGVVVEATPRIEMGSGIVPDVKCVLERTDHRNSEPTTLRAT